MGHLPPAELGVGMTKSVNDKTGHDRRGNQHLDNNIPYSLSVQHVRGASQGNVSLFAAAGCNRAYFVVKSLSHGQISVNKYSYRSRLGELFRLTSCKPLFSGQPPTQRL